MTDVIRRKIDRARPTHAAFHDLRLHPALSKASPALPDGCMPFPFTRVFFIQERA